MGGPKQKGVKQYSEFFSPPPPRLTRAEGRGRLTWDYGGILRLRVQPCHRSGRLHFGVRSKAGLSMGLVDSRNRACTLYPRWRSRELLRRLNGLNGPLRLDRRAVDAFWTTCTDSRTAF